MEFVKLVHFVRSFIRFSIGGEPNLFAMFFEKLIPLPNTIPKV